MKHKVRYAQFLPLLLMLFASPVGVRDCAAQAIALPPAVPRLAPNFSRFDLEHRKVQLSAYRGKVVLLNFWATWCGPCLLEMPRFMEWQKQFGPGKFQVIGISMDDATPEVVATISELKIDYPVLMGDEHLGEAYGGVLGLPVTFLIDEDGKIRQRYGSVDLARIKGDIQNLLQAYRVNSCKG